MNLATIGWPSGTDTGWPLEPKNMLPGRVEDWPHGSQASANTAERLLSQAVGWWDAAFYRPGDRLLRNRGVAGDLLDLQLGSSDRVATSNDPLFLAPEDTGYVYLPGAANNSMSVPDEAALDITGDIDIRVRVALDDYTITTNQIIAAKDDNATNRSYIFDLLNIAGGSALRMRFGGTGSSYTHTATSSVAPPFTDMEPYWIRVTVDVDNGSSQAVVTFYYASDFAEPSSWTQLGTTQTLAGAASIFSGSSPFSVGEVGGVSTATGKVYRAVVYSDLTETTKVLDVDCDAITDGSNTSFTAVTGQTVTINRRISSGRKSVAVPRRNGGGRSLFLFGTDDYMECVGGWQHQLLNFDAGDSFTVLAVVRQWGTQPTSQHLSKKADLVASAGWTLYNVGTTNGFGMSEGSSIILRTSTPTLGAVNTLTGVRDTAAKRFSYFYGGAATGSGVAASDTTQGSLSNQVNMAVGRASSTNSRYADFEFLAAAVWRRPLTAAEIRTITTYYTNRGY